MKKALTLLLALSLCISILPMNTSAEALGDSIAEQFVSVALGYDFCAAITSDGDLYTWGENSKGQLGLGDLTNRTVPTKVSNLSNVVALSLSSTSCAAVTSGGMLFVWGTGGTELGLGSGYHTQKTPARVDLSDVVSVSLGTQLSAAVTSDGYLYVWGYNNVGQLGFADTEDRAEPTRLSGIPNVTDVGLGSNFGIALTSTGRLYAWGNNRYGQLATGETNDLTVPEMVHTIVNVKAISVDYNYCMAITKDGSVFAWGQNLYGQLGTGSTDDLYYPTKVSGISDVTSIACRTCHSAAVTSDGSLYTWGVNIYGELGVGNSAEDYYSTPQQVHGLPAVSAVGLGNLNSAAISSDGNLFLSGSYFGYDANGTRSNWYSFQPANSVFQFPKENMYIDGQFLDVSSSDWYSGSVAAAYELGLMQGGSNAHFCASNNITIGESIVLAARIHRIYTTGTDDFSQGSPWYQVYVDYALANGVIESEYSNYLKSATRAEFISILAGALPDNALGVINPVDDGMIPDVSASAAFYQAVYELYRAGVLTGNDDSGTFAPDNHIDRGSVASIVARMADMSLRKSVSLRTPVPVQSVTLSETAVSLDVGKTQYLDAYVKPLDTTDGTVTWSSSDPSVATIKNGTVTAQGGGTAVITATAANGVSADCTVTVTTILATSISISPVNCTLTAGDSTTLYLTYTPSNATDKWISWSTSDSSIATVSKGIVIAVSPGTAVITATSSGGLKAICNVTVAAADTTPSLPQPSSGSSTILSAEEIYKRCSPAVLCLSAYDKNGNSLGFGSGFFITNNGLAVTNYHVIEGGSTFKIYLTNGSSYWVDRVLGYSSSRDLAILSIKGSSFTALPIGHSSAVTGGQTIYTIGTPLGLSSTISDGIISNPYRVVDGTTYIQISAPISSGSSGGALINQYGQVIGVTTAGFVDGQNLNLAVPIDLIYSLTLN